MRHNYLKGNTPLVRFIARSLKYTLGNYNFTEKPILVLVHKADQTGLQQTVTRLVTDAECSKLINDCFWPIGILSSNPEIKMLLRFIPVKSMPCLLILRMVGQQAGKKQVKADDLIMLTPGPDGSSVTVEKLYADLVNYVKQRNASGSNFVIAEQRAVEKDRK